jgi:hypothetical protein
MINWDNYIQDQQELCSSQGLDWTPAYKELKIGLADNVLTDMTPINGLRHSQENGTTGWYIWAGQNFSESEDFFKPFCVKHLAKLKPEIIKYLGLPPGHRFLIDDKGYGDIWKDNTLLKID